MSNGSEPGWQTVEAESEDGASPYGSSVTNGKRAAASSLYA
jgi:hypothetical protein